MNPLKFLLILRARYQIAVLVALLTIAAGLAANELLPRRYTAETAVMVDVRSPDPISALLMPSMMIPGNLGTQLDIIKSDRVGRKVVTMLKLHEDPAVKEMWRNATGGRGKLEDWMSGLLLRGVKVTPSRDSNMLTISYQGGDPVFVTAVANAVAQAYIEASVELKVEPARQYGQWFGEQAKSLREAVEKAQAELSDFQRRKGIVAADEAVDNEHLKLRDLAARLTAVQGEIRDAQSKQRGGKGTVDTLPEVMQNSAVQSLRGSINQLEVKLKEAAGNLGLKHPQYQRMEAELAELKNRLAVETSHAASGVTSTGAVGRTREAELKDAIAAQTKKVLEMKSERDEISVLVRDVETAKRAYEAVTTRLTQTNLESQATRTNVFVLTPAVEPAAPSFPVPRSTILLTSLLLGILLGGASVIGIELLDPRIRTADDLAEMLQLPVLAVIERNRFPRRLTLRSGATALPAR
jgi:succinoglycan biosynthesis transport protein ExoP